jgi:hypothetical protein
MDEYRSGQEEQSAISSQREGEAATGCRHSRCEDEEQTLCVCGNCGGKLPRLGHVNAKVYVPTAPGQMCQDNQKRPPTGCYLEGQARGA